MSSPSSPPGESGSSIEGLLEHERRYLEESRPAEAGAAGQGEPSPVDPRLVSRQRGLCGLALSGGGLRSATYNLGLLQGLHQLGLLEMFDYLATVSGGGYIGGFWTAWRHYRGWRSEPGKEEAPLFPTNEQGWSRGAQLPEVRHLREFSNFLVPRLGLLSLDTGRMLVALVSAIVPALLAALSFLVLGLLLYRLLAHVLFATGGPPLRRLLVSEGLLLLLTCAGLYVYEWLFSRQEQQVKAARQEQRVKDCRGRPAPPPEDAQESEFRRFGYYLPATLLALGCVALLWAWFIHGGQVGAWSFGGEQTRGSGLFAPTAAWLGAAGVLIMVRWLGSRFVTEWMQRTNLAAIDRVISRLLLLALFWSAVTALWLAGWYLWDRVLIAPNPMRALLALQTGLAGAVAVLTTLLARLQQLLGRHTNKPVSPDRRERAKSALPQLLAYVTLALLVLGMVLLILAAANQGWLRWLAVAAAAITVLTLLFFDSNLVGLHVFYRGRIARTFIGAAHGEGPGRTEPHTKDDFPLDRLELEPRPGPLH
ncbi:MAG: patatin-like phospholipase family protein, partial [Archangium sp.]